MRIKELLQESPPLPDDWDKDIYNDRIPFKTRVRYAKERAMQMGVGSSRIAFKIPYQGRDTVLKIAKNRKGMAQNENEAQLLSEPYLSQFNITIPLIDYDESSNTPTWIHTEFAEKIRPNQMKAFTNGLDIHQFMELAAYSAGGNNNHPTLGFRYANEIEEYKLEDNDFFHMVSRLIADYYGLLKWQDLTVLRNWGLYRGSPVIIDLGLSEDVYTMHYT